MIDLSNAKIGDWYSYDSNGEAKLIALGTEEACFIFKDNTGFLVTDLNGCNSDGIPVVVSKIDPRPWLKDMPDAGIFADEVKWMKYSFECKCWFYAFYGDSGDMRNVPLKMPTPTGEQRSDNKISTEELREWQEANK